MGLGSIGKKKEAIGSRYSGGWGIQVIQCVCVCTEDVIGMEEVRIGKIEKDKKVGPIEICRVI